MTMAKAKATAVVQQTGGELAPLPFDRARVVAGYQQAPRAASGGAMFLRMQKGTGEWSYGVDGEPLPAKTILAVNPASFVHGWIAWRDTTSGAPVEKLGEKMVAAFEPMPESGPTPGGARKWDVQQGVGFKRMDTGEPLVYLTTSVGGLRAVTELRDKVLQKLAGQGDDVIALVRLEHDSYKHQNKMFGTIFIPIFNITGWCSHSEAEKRAQQLAKVK
jgi:hypothetical protein